MGSTYVESPVLSEFNLSLPEDDVQADNGSSHNNSNCATPHVDLNSSLSLAYLEDNESQASAGSQFMLDDVSSENDKIGESANCGIDESSKDFSGYAFNIRDFYYDESKLQGNCSVEEFMSMNEFAKSLELSFVDLSRTSKVLSSTSCCSCLSLSSWSLMLLTYSISNGPKTIEDEGGSTGGHQEKMDDKKETDC